MRPHDWAGDRSPQPSPEWPWQVCAIAMLLGFALLLGIIEAVLRATALHTGG